MRINSFTPTAVRFGSTPEQERTLGKVLRFLQELPEDISDQQLHARLSMDLIGPSFGSVTDHAEYAAVKKVAESNQYPEKVVQLAQRSLERLDNFYGDMGDGGFID